MDCIPEKEKDIVIDIDSCIDTSKEVGTLSLLNEPLSVDESVKSGNLQCFLKNVNEVSPDSKKEKRKTMSGKRPPKPPRPPRGLSLDAADQRLIKEIAEIAMIKRARIERMKALKKMKAAKPSSSVSASSSGNMLAMLFTVLFCIVVVFQGCHSSGLSSKKTSEIAIPGSLHSSGATTEGNIITVKNQWNTSTSSAPIGDGSHSLKELILGSDGRYEERKAIY